MRTAAPPLGVHIYGLDQRALRRAGRRWLGGGVIRFLVRMVVLAAIIGLVADIVPGIHVHGGFGALLWIAFLFSAVQVILGPILLLFSLPLIILTTGLFLFVINTALLATTAGLSSHLDVDGFGSALLGSTLITVFGWLARRIYPSSWDRRRRVGAAAKPRDPRVIDMQ
ncbi:MAG TPA: phage holin family protein [Mycobacteriales bacterium]|nr:phage holin family protein [Mycobacteriales bacterium]